MRILNNYKWAAVALAAVVALGACSKSDESGSASSSAASASGAALLEYVPANTPYVLASTTPVPDEVMDRLEPILADALKAYAAIIQAAIADSATDEEGESRSEEEQAKMQAVGDAISEMMTLKGIRGAGIGRESTSVLYGNGLLPVLRMSLTDGALMEAAIARIETRVDSKMAVATLDGVDYRYAGDEKARVVIAVIGSELVIGLVPTSASEATLKSTLGLTKPASNIAESGALSAMAKQYGLLPYMHLLFDTTRIAATFTQPQTGPNKELMALLEHDSANVSAECRSEITEMGGVMPRIVGGYTALSPDGFTESVVLEVRKDLATGLSGLVAPVQGLGTTKGGLFSFGMSFDLQAIKDFYSARLDAMEAAPYKCEHFADLQDGVAKGREMMQQPVMPIIYSIKGFLANVDAIEGLDLATKQPPTSIDASFLLSVDSPQALLAMGQMFNPDLAALEIKPDGVPVKMALPPIASGISEAYLAMNDKSLGFAVGKAGEKQLAALLGSKYATPPPFLNMTMNGESYYGFVGQAMEAAQQDKLASGESSAEMNAAMSDLMKAMQSVFGRMDVNVNFTQRGVEIVSNVEMLEAK